MALVGALQTATSGLFTSPSSIDAVARNLAGAPGDATARRLDERTTPVAGRRGPAVRVEDLAREIGTELKRDVRAQAATVRGLAVIDEVMGRLGETFGRPEDRASLPARLDDLRAAFRGLADTAAEGTPAPAAAIDAARDLAATLAATANHVQTLRAEADRWIERDVGEVNQLLIQIETLNHQVGPRGADGTGTGDLREQRDAAFSRLNDLLSVRGFERGDAQLTVFVGRSRVILDDVRMPLDFARTAGFAPGETGAPLSIDTFGTKIDITAEARDKGEGEIAGLLRLRDTILPRAQAQLDSLAFELMRTFGQGAAAGTPIRLFTDADGAIPAEATPGLANAIRVGDAIAGAPARLLAPRDRGDGGAGEAASPATPAAIVGLLETPRAFVASVGGVDTGLSGEETLGGFAERIIGAHASLKSDNESQLIFQRTLGDALGERVQNGAAVNVDDELSRLGVLENAFAGSSRVLTVVRDALDDVIGIVR